MCGQMQMGISGRHRFLFAWLGGMFTAQGSAHQIRVHLKSIGHPLLGDPVYGPASIPPQAARLLRGVSSELLEGQILHAKVLGFVHPITGQYMEFDQGLPSYFLEILDALRKNKGNL